MGSLMGHCRVSLVILVPSPSPASLPVSIAFFISASPVSLFALAGMTGHRLVILPVAVFHPMSHVGHVVPHQFLSRFDPCIFIRIIASDLHRMSLCRFGFEKK
eukprot:RCo050683